MRGRLSSIKSELQAEARMMEADDSMEEMSAAGDPASGSVEGTRFSLSTNVPSKDVMRRTWFSTLFENGLFNWSSLDSGFSLFKVFIFSENC